VASVRSWQKLPLSQMEPVPAGSKTDPPLAKVKPIINNGSPVQPAVGDAASAGGLD